MMSTQRESIFASALRSFMRALFTVFGVFLGLIPIMIVIAGASAHPTIPLSSRTHVQIAPDAEGNRDALGKDTPLILEIDIHGVIGTEQLNTQTIQTILQESQEAPIETKRVMAIMLHISSPGGTTSDSDSIYRMIKAYKKRFGIPVYAYVDGLCASGGVYVSAAADKIFATPNSLIGSVGVMIPPFFNFSAAMEKWGVSAKTLTAGTDKDSFNPTRTWKANEGQDIENSMEYLYQSFVDIVVENRPNMDRDNLVNEIGARVFPAPQALEIGFIDEIVDVPEEALRELALEAGIASKGYQVIRLEGRNWISEIFTSSNPLWRGKVQHELQWMPGMDSRLNNQFLYLHTLHH